MSALSISEIEITNNHSYLTSTSSKSKSNRIYLDQFLFCLSKPISPASPSLASLPSTWSPDNISHSPELCLKVVISNFQLRFHLRNKCRHWVSLFPERYAFTMMRMTNTIAVRICNNRGSHDCQLPSLGCSRSEKVLEENKILMEETFLKQSL